MKTIEERIKDYLSDNLYTNINDKLEISYEDITSNNKILIEFLDNIYNKSFNEVLIPNDNIKYTNCQILYKYNFMNFQNIIIFKKLSTTDYTITNNKFNVLYKNLKSLKDIVELYPDYMILTYNNYVNEINIKTWEVIINKSSKCFSYEKLAIKYIMKLKLFNNLNYKEKNNNNNYKDEKLYLYKNYNNNSRKLIKTLYKQY